jgi:hypothetical protein
MSPAGTPRNAPKTPVVQPADNGTPELEIALLRRGVDLRDAGQERCAGCQRSPLVGETVYVDVHGSVFCELCRELEPVPPRESRVVHGPEYGHTMKLTDRRVA